jgi:hypothetical protein
MRIRIFTLIAITSLLGAGIVGVYSNILYKNRVEGDLGNLLEAGLKEGYATFHGAYVAGPVAYSYDMDSHRLDYLLYPLYPAYVSEDEPIYLIVKNKTLHLNLSSIDSLTVQDLNPESLIFSGFVRQDTLPSDEFDLLTTRGAMIADKYYIFEYGKQPNPPITNALLIGLAIVLAVVADQYGLFTILGLPTGYGHRVSRSAYFAFGFAPWIIFAFAFTYTSDLFPSGYSNPFIWAFILSIINSIYEGVGRCHDLNKSGACLLLNLIPIFGFFWSFYLMLAPSQPKSEK